MNKETLRMQMLAGIITEGQYKGKLNEEQAIGTIFYKDEDGDYVYDEEKLINNIQSMGYEDAEEIVKEITTISSPEDDLEIFRNKYNQPDLEIEDITIDMVKQSIEDEFEKTA